MTTSASTQSVSTKGTALITGASSGIGAVYADRLAHRGYDLVLVARRGDKLRALADELSRTTGRRIEPVEADLDDEAGLARVEDLLRRRADIRVLVNNAGVAATTPLLESEFAGVQGILSLNVNALTRLTYAAVPRLVAQGGGTLINIASIVGVAPEMLNGVYGASKAYVIALTQSLQHELGDKGLRVQAVLPGATATALWDVAGGVDKLPPQIVMTAEDMVDAALAGLDLGEIITIPSLPDVADWTAYEDARRKLAPNLSHAKPAARYATARNATATA